MLKMNENLLKKFKNPKNIGRPTTPADVRRRPRTTSDVFEITCLTVLYINFKNEASYLILNNRVAF